uniref:Uncharacterized protein n=1 Tax=Ceratitis capitata TaxID=7213 RepID=W8BEH9_CERCA
MCACVPYTEQRNLVKLFPFFLLVVAASYLQFQNVFAIIVAFAGGIFLINLLVRFHKWSLHTITVNIVRSSSQRTLESPKTLYARHGRGRVYLIADCRSL